MELRNSGLPRPKSFECKNPLEKFSPRFFGIKTVSSSLIIFQRVTLLTRSITNLCWWNWRTFWRINAAGRSTRGSCSGTTMPRFTGYLQHRRNWPGLPGLLMSWSPTLFSGSGPVGLPPVSWTEKKMKGRHFSSDMEVILAAETWLDGQHSEFFFEWLAKVGATA